MSGALMGEGMPGEGMIGEGMPGQGMVSEEIISEALLLASSSAVIPGIIEEVTAIDAGVLPLEDQAEGLLEEQFPAPPAGAAADLSLYRDRTATMLRRYARLSVEVGRLPSLLGREFFRTKVTSYRVGTFEDAVIFVHDVEQALESLDGFEKKLIAMMLLQDYTQEETARLLGCSLRTINRRLPEALDVVSGIFLEGGLLAPLPIEAKREKSCQGGQSDENCLSDCEQTENKF